MYKTLIILLIGVTVARAIVCPPGFCDNVKCQSVSCSENQERKEAGTICGCCPACITVVKKGGSCSALFLRGTPPKIKCDEGLNCNIKTKTCQ
ncbi:u35-Nephitoxin-Nsp1a_1 [Caerostris extrusa]|uniref:U35-Nephitoxin-Nsp1a_1 n=1 Tax=Caerostris extrusa TaxID=172846 RepID=A0AAV4VXV8_CAEEX|nr:u35-Nephitoxin-Nsp1a_1 [Caerostris extrusa]